VSKDATFIPTKSALETVEQSMGSFADKVNMTMLDPEVVDVELRVTVGAVPSGVVADDAVENALDPTPFVARTLNVYGVPFVKPVTSSDVVVDTPSTNVVQLPPTHDCTS
jgi:hypothetical protein